MAKTKWVPMEFNGTGSNNAFSAHEETKHGGCVRKVLFRNQGTAIANVHVGALNGPAVQLNPRESVALDCGYDDYDTSTFYVTWTGAGTQSVICLIQKTMD